MIFNQGGGLGQFNQGIAGWPGQQNYGQPTLITSGGTGYFTYDYAAALAAMQKEQSGMNMNGNKPIVVCGGEQREAKDMDDAQQIAESLAHSKSADAYILKPVKKVSPKRDVVTTDL